MAPTRRLNGRSPLVRKQSQITAFFNSGLPNPNRSPDPSPSQGKKRKKNILAIPQSPNPVTPPVAPKKKSFSADVVGRRIRVFWPLDQAWYEGYIKSFDKLSGKHVIQYDDAEEEIVDLGMEEIELLEEAPRTLRRLKKMSAPKKKSAEEEPLRRTLRSVQMDTPKMEEVEEGSGEEDDSTEDEEWGKEGIGKDVGEDDSDDEMELEDEEKVMKSMGRGRARSLGSRKRKKAEVGKLDCTKKIRFDGNVEKIAASAPPKLVGSSAGGTSNGINSEQTALIE